MAELNKEQLILSLIKDDLINAKLISGLENLGIDAGLYLISVSDAIFVLMGIEDDKKGEDLFEFYLELRDDKLNQISLKETYAELDGLASTIYNKLKNKIGKN